MSLPARAGKAIGIMSCTVPNERFPELVAWIFPLVGHDYHDNMTRIWQMVMPAPAFAGDKELIKKAIGSDWGELTCRNRTNFMRDTGIPHKFTSKNDLVIQSARSPRHTSFPGKDLFSPCSSQRDNLVRL